MSGHTENSGLYTPEEATDYWRRVHALAADDFSEQDDELLPVVADPGTPDWEKRYVARFQHKAMLRTLRHAPKLSGLRGLEFGCGTGRWVRLLTGLGAEMVGVDISADVIERNRRVIDQAEFRCVDVTKEPPEPAAYDFVLSVTVVQHLPFDVQEAVVRVLSEALKPGGTFIMLENIHDRRRTVFPRSISGWKDLARANRLECTYVRGYGFDVLPRLGRRLLGVSGFGSKANVGWLQLSPEELAKTSYERYRTAKRWGRYSYVFRPLVAASYCLEPLSQVVMPSGWATHCAFVFEKT